MLLVVKDEQHITFNIDNIEQSEGKKIIVFRYN